MATHKVDFESNAYDKIENIVMNKIYMLENENSQLKRDLALAQAKLEVYERIASISDSKHALGFGPPTIKE